MEGQSMKVELLVNLKTALGKIVSRGTIFSDENNPIPDFIMNRMKRGMARIISAPAPSISEVSLKSEIPLKNKEEKVILLNKEKEEIPSGATKVKIIKKTVE